MRRKGPTEIEGGPKLENLGVGGGLWEFREQGGLKSRKESVGAGHKPRAGPARINRVKLTFADSKSTESRLWPSARGSQTYRTLSCTWKMESPAVAPATRSPVRLLQRSGCWFFPVFIP